MCVCGVSVYMFICVCVCEVHVYMCLRVHHGKGRTCAPERRAFSHPFRHSSPHRPHPGAALWVLSTKVGGQSPPGGPSLFSLGPQSHPLH